MTSIPPVHVPQVMTTIVYDKVIDIKDEDVIVAPDPETVGFNNQNDFEIQDGRCCFNEF